MSRVAHGTAVTARVAAAAAASALPDNVVKAASVGMATGSSAFVSILSILVSVVAGWILATLTQLPSAAADASGGTHVVVIALVTGLVVGVLIGLRLGGSAPSPASMETGRLKKD